MTLALDKQARVSNTLRQQLSACLNEGDDAIENALFARKLIPPYSRLSNLAYRVQQSKALC